MRLITKKRFIRLANKMVVPYEITKINQLIEYLTSTTEIIATSYSSGKGFHYSGAIFCRIIGYDDMYNIICGGSYMEIRYHTRCIELESKPKKFWYDYTECHKQKRWDDPTPIENRRDPSCDKWQWSLDIYRSDEAHFYPKLSCDPETKTKVYPIADIFGVNIR